ncbi:hypothetical protein FB45DRAFT_1062361 [Roridomyces roridus]|uniref:Ricin B lectin domain-containing protein n=1 Tax=Roridomyces roridus TaxID=1738132 RepID=A0AAD7BHW0_9AGAR|nr:hypothetical protein FB45DRAFT_1062361 [Roridomyces roridus]
MFPTTALLTASLLALASATPMRRQTTTPQCNPNFEGVAVSIIDNDVSWGVSPEQAGTVLDRDLFTQPLNATAHWHVEQTGSFPATYLVKEINHNNLVVATDVLNGGLLTLEEIDSTKSTQIWSISCDVCVQGAASAPNGGKFASGCHIRSAANELCADVQPAGTTLGVEPCGQTILQTWDFWTATSA